MNNQVSNSKSLFLSLLLIIGLSFSLSAQKGNEVSKVISESYKVTKDFTLGIDNKYGRIDIVNWDKNELEVLVEMSVKALSEDKANKILNKINIDINKGSGGVDFVTDVDFKSMTGKTSLEINYKVSAPASINVKLVQKYGSIFLEEISGDANIVVKYGDLKAHSLVNEAGNTNEVVLGYSDGVIKNAGMINTRVAYSDMNLGSIVGFDGRISYSDVSVKNLSGKFVTEAAYSDLSIDNVAAGFNAIDISSAYGDVEVNMNENAAYRYKLEATYGSLDIPSGDGKVSKSEHGNHKEAKGSVGGSPSGEVVISAKYADVSLR